MPTACVNQPTCRVRLRSERLEVFGPNEAAGGREEVLREIPIRDLDRLIVREGTQISSEALAAMLRAEIPVSLIGWNGTFLGAFTPAGPAHGLWRLKQYQATLDSGFVLAAARALIAAKIYNQRRVLQRMAANRAQSLADPLAWLDGMLNAASRAGSVDEVRGCEGAASAKYFMLWAEFLPAAFPFERRSRRPPHNAVNACLSFAAVLLYNETTAFLHSHGLDPALGTLHATEDGRWSLALDLIEPFRPVLVEALALDLFTHEMLKGGHFEARDGGVFLNTDGRAKFLLQYERRMERQFLSEHAGNRTTLRQQLENQAVAFKASLERPGAFEPFLMN